MKTVVHVTHEALQKIGGIGAVLQGLCTSKAYLEKVDRNILVGPMFGGDGEAAEQLDRFGELLYSSGLGIDKGNWGEKFRPIQDELGVSIMYGRRLFRDGGNGGQSRPEVLLVGIDHMKEHPLAVFKLRLWETFGIQSDIYDAWDYEQYTRIALPAYRALAALDVDKADQPATIMAHEYMGMPLALLAVLENDRQYRTLFYAHETATIRRIVEKHPGHDTMFYNVMRRAADEGKYVEDVFGPQTPYFKHPLVASARHCDGALAVGDLVVEEMRFLAPEFADFNIRLVYNGIPSHKIDLAEKMRSRGLMQDYAEKLTGTRPEVIMTHVTRLARSKGLWRDLKVLWRLEQAARKTGRTGVLFVLSTELGGPRATREIQQMASQYGWPLAHREGYPDLSGGEAEFYAFVQRFNTCSRNIKTIFVNQFGWSAKWCGPAMPAEMDFKDIRQGSDLEFGQSIYEPFGIAQLEPLAFGGLCVLTGVCGCAGFLRRVAGDGDIANAVLADYTHLEKRPDSLAEMLRIGIPERSRIEEAESTRVAEEILRKLPTDQGGMQRMLESGYDLARHMGWDAVAREYVLPAIAEADAKP
ncbi:MAG: hypothetical protein GWP05_02490 [Anaerolineaceae bacterium]|nr:hypothetical protein [Anaerolineaceae bacterium]